jgi:hypothetical protein
VLYAHAMPLRALPRVLPLLLLLLLLLHPLL